MIPTIPFGFSVFSPYNFIEVLDTCIFYFQLPITEI